MKDPNHERLFKLRPLIDHLFQTFQQVFQQVNCTSSRICRLFSHWRRIQRSARKTEYSVQKCSHISPCYTKYGQEESCGHKIGQPRNLTVLPGNHSQCPEQDTLVVQWYPSEYGILFLQGFIVELKSDSGYGVLSKCQQIIINKRGVLQNEDASMVLGTTFCVPLSTTYSIRVRAYPVPMGTEKDKDIFTEVMFTSRTCKEVYGAHHCEGCLHLDLYAENECYKNWAPTNITIFGSNKTVSIEFDSAPDEYNIRYYLVYYRGFEEESWRMKMVPHKKSQGNSRLKDVLENFKPGVNYTFMVSSDLTDSACKEVYYVFPETESVPKVVFIVAPLLVMVTGVALGFIIAFVCSAKKKVAGGLNEGEESFGRCLRDPQCQTKPLRVAPHVFLCYSSCEGPAHTHLVLAFAHYLQQHCSCQVTLDLWEELVIAREGHVSWMSSHIESCDFVIIICSKTLKDLVDTKSSVEVDFRNLFVASVSLVGEILGQDLIFKRDISKFIVVSFQEDIHLQTPSVLQLATKYRLMEDFPKLFSHLHSLELLQPGLLLHVSNINQDDYFMVNSGYLLYCAIKKSYFS